MKDALKNGIFPLLNCDNYVIENENDENEWAAIPTLNMHFKCARIIYDNDKKSHETPCKTYAVGFLSRYDVY